MTTKAKTFWAFALTSIALFMTALDILVVTTALPVIKQQLGGGVEALEWVVNGYTLPFAVLLLTGAALGDRFGRRRMFVAGIGIFTAGSAAAALAPSIQLLIAARAFQGVGGAIITPLTLTILTDAVPAEKRGMALGAWSGIGASPSRSVRSSAAPSPKASAGSGSSGSTCRSACCCSRSPAPSSPRATDQTRTSTCRASASPAPVCSGSSGRSFAATRPAGRASRSPVRPPPGWRCWPRSSPGSCAARRRCCRCASSATAPSRPPTQLRWRCISACSARSSCSPSSCSR
jgi:hypothetical protein